MKYLKISNDGILDVRLVPLMGGTTKSEDDVKIGQFGTGLKYVMAYMLRHEIEFHVRINREVITIETKPETIAGTVFGVVWINGEKTSITTNMGLEWKPWMIVRELYSNALDEGGAKYEAVENIEPEEGRTEFYLEFTPEIMSVYNGWNNYFNNTAVPMYKGNGFDVFPVVGPLRLYKQGILIHESESVISLFNYDIKRASINELRQYQGSLEYDISMCVNNLDRRTIEYLLENIQKDHYEGTIDYSYVFASGDFSSTWKETIGDAKLIHEEAVNNMKARGLDIDTEGTIVIPKSLYKGLTKKFKGIGALRIANKVNEFYEVHDEVLTAKIKKAVAILDDCGYMMHPDLKIIYGFFGDKRIMARVDMDDKLIMVSEQILHASMFDTCAMLIEENEHFNTGLTDCTRGFQQHFINLYTATLFHLNKVEL